MPAPETIYSKLSSQVGIMINGTTVDNLLVGGPAYSSKKLAQGDIIISVDSTEATEANIVELLVGNDTPGTPMEIVVAKGGIKASNNRIISFSIFIKSMKY